MDLQSAADLQNAGRLKQLRFAAGMIHRGDKRALPIAIGSGVLVLVVLVVVGLVLGSIGSIVSFAILGVLAGTLTTMILFGRYAQAAQYKAIEGQPGAAAAVMQQVRGNWTVTPAVNGNRNMDVVHRMVGRAGVVLVAEGDPRRVAQLLANEKKRTARVAFDVPIFDFTVGDGEDQVPISKLQRKIMRLPRNLNGAAVTDLNRRLKALQPALQMPKGPIPKNARMPRPRMR